MYHVIQSSVISKGGVFEDTICSSSWPGSLQVLENALSSARGPHYFLTCWKFAKVMSIAGARQRTCEFLSEDLFFLWSSPEFCGKFATFWAENFSRYVLGPLASRGSVLEKCVLGLGFFFVSSTPPLVLYYKNWGVELTSRCFIFMYLQKTTRRNNESTTEE